MKLSTLAVFSSEEYLYERHDFLAAFISGLNFEYFA